MDDVARDYQGLKESEERLQAFMRYSPVLAFMKDAEGRYIYMNPAMERVFNVKLADIQGKADHDWLPQRVAETVRQNDLWVLSTGQTLETLEVVPTPDGTERTWLVLKFPFTGSGGQPAVGGVAVDITDRQTIEETARRKEHELRTLLDNSPDIVARLDRDLRIRYLNRAAARPLGGVPDAHVGKSLREAGMPADQAEMLERQLQQAVSSGKEVRFETMYDTGGEAVYYHVRLTPELNAEGRTESVLFSSRDITRLKQTEKRLLESERRFRRLFESSLGLIWTHDLNGTLLAVNAAAAKCVGDTQEGLVGTHMRDLLLPALQPEFDHYLERVRSHGTDDGLLVVRTRSGEIRTWKYHNALVSEGDDPDYVLGHAQDVTELKRAQEAASSLSLTDELTGLYNRRGFLALAAQHVKLARAGRAEHGLLMLYADMDGLKAINDRFGHHVGSTAIGKVADVLRRTFRHTDIIARIGGDEFVVLMINAWNESAESVCARVEENLREFNAQRAYPFELALSVGASEIGPGERLSIEDLLRTADEAMYAKKRRKHP